MSVQYLYNAFDTTWCLRNRTGLKCKKMFCHTCIVYLSLKISFEIKHSKYTWLKNITLMSARCRTDISIPHRADLNLTLQSWLKHGHIKSFFSYWQLFIYHLLWILKSNIKKYSNKIYIDIGPISVRHWADLMPTL